MPIALHYRAGTWKEKNNKKIAYIVLQNSIIKNLENILVLRSHKNSKYWWKLLEEAGKREKDGKGEKNVELTPKTLPTANAD